MKELRRRKKLKLGFPARLHSSLDLFSFDRTAFPLMLAAASAAEADDPRSWPVLKFFLRAHLALLTSPMRSALPPSILLPRSLLSLVPLFLTSSFPALAAQSAQLVGAASRHSFDANLIIVSDEAIVGGLITALVSRSRRVAKAACNAVLDLSASSIGRTTLRKFYAIEKLLSLLCQVHESPIRFLPLLQKETTLALFLDAALLLINTSDEGSFGCLPDELSQKVLSLLKELFKHSCKMEETSNCIMPSKKYDLAAAVFRLSMDIVFHVPWNIDELRGAIFGDEESSFENFIFNYWEASHLLINGARNKLEGTDYIFNSLSNSFGCMKNEDVLTSLLRKFVSCPPISSDELDIFNFIKEANHLLGCQICYGQDIRVLKTSMITLESMQGTVGEEVHFFNHRTGSEFADELSVGKLKEALQDGYTIALRGMEFRNDAVAAVTEGVSNLFGQPSIGANLYITPPRSQGLAKHYDDHCVFVWQIFGKKQWRISPRPDGFLPRLYEPLCALKNPRKNDGSVDILLTEGDILYVPRGYPHEAHTVFNMDEAHNAAHGEFSMHLTLGIEVEPPFEWEGFTHIALNCWNRKKKIVSVYPIDSELVKLRSVLVNILHVAIRFVANKHSVFKKACLISAHSYSPSIQLNHNAHFLAVKLKSTFDYIIQTISSSSNFPETFISIATAVHENNEDYLQWMRWFRHLPQEDVKVNFDNPLELFKEFFLLNYRHTKELMVEFTQVKSEFCASVVYEDACDDFVALLEKYRKTRRQYMNGMMSLHMI